MTINNQFPLKIIKKNIAEKI